MTTKDTTVRIQFPRDRGLFRASPAGATPAPCSPHDNPKGNYMIGRKCIIRCYASGVHFGTVSAHDGRQVTLTNARRLWRWHTGGKDKGVSLSAVAVTGIDASRSTVEPVVAEIVLLDALEIIPATDAAIAMIEAA